MRFIYFLGILGVCGVLLLYKGCSITSAQPQFHPADLVLTVLDGQKGQVAYVDCLFRPSCIYWVRFAANEATTNTNVASDDPITLTPYALVRMAEFEIMKR